jgi:hypothetical protein
MEELGIFHAHGNEFMAFMLVMYGLSYELAKWSCHSG